MGTEHRRMALALLLSLLMHALLLSLTFGGQGAGLPGFGFPWRDRRIEAPDLRIVLIPREGAAAEAASTPVAGPSRTESIEQPIARAQVPAPFVAATPPVVDKAVADVPAVQPTAEAESTQNAASADAGQAPFRDDGPGDAAPPQVSEPAATEVKPPGGAVSATPAAESVPSSVIVAAPSASSPETVTLAERGASDIAQPRFDPEPREQPLQPTEPDLSEREPRPQADIPEDTREEAARLERERQEAARLEADRLAAEQRESERRDAARQEAARLEAARAEAERQEAERREAARQEAARREAERVEAERHEAEREEAARREAASIEAERREGERREAARQEAARREAERLQSERQEAERQEAERQEAERQEAARQETARRESERLEAERREAERREAARQETARQEAARQEAERRDAEREEAARREAARVEAERREAERREAARQEAARREAERAEADRREAEHQDAARREAARREAERLDAERREAQRQEAARQEAAREEAARAEAARQAQARQDAQVEAKRQEEARRQERLQAIGRQLDEEAAQRDAASTAARASSTLPLSLSTARRARLWGRADANAELIRYAEAWERKIQLNTPLETVRELANRPHTTPMVTVAIRSNGSVESVTFVRSSGVAEVDEAIRRIVHSHEHYPAFPPALALEFDVIEIRRTWQFDVAVRLY